MTRDPRPRSLHQPPAALSRNAGAAEYQLNDSTRYFWDRAAEILKTDYLPSPQDILRARVRTTGIVQQNFKIAESQYTMFDVGGQRNERRKWIHCFDNVTAVIFVTAISEYDQVLYEDENTNRMDEALMLFDQILNHPSFAKTSMILFLNKRDLFAEKLKRKDLTCWNASCTAGKDYDAAIDFIKTRFLEKNKEPEKRQVYVHPTCATDTTNVQIVMDSVFDIILKENLRKMNAATVDVSAASGTGVSKAKYPPTFARDTVILCGCHFVESLKERVVAADAGTAMLPGVEIGPYKVTAGSSEFAWVMSLGKNVPALSPAKAELGSFKGDFKEAAKKLREAMGLGAEGLLGSVYDKPILMETSGVTLLVCVLRLPEQKPIASLKWKVFEDFEDACYPKYMGVTEKNLPPPKGEEFNPFAPNPVGHRWFKGVTLFTEQVQKQPVKGVYLGIFKVYSGVDGFMVMVNEHNRVMIPTIFLTENQLSAEELKWMQGARLRGERWDGKTKGPAKGGAKAGWFEEALIDGAKPNRGWLGPEMSGEDAATFAEKMWWAVDEAKARLGDVEDLGALYDAEVLDVDENNSIQLVMFASMAKTAADILPGHIWVDRSFLEVQNMKYMSPLTLGNLMQEQNAMMDQLTKLDASTGEAADMAAMQQTRAEKTKLKEKIEATMNSQQPLKWVNRVIMWVADKMPSFTDKVPGAADMETSALIDAGIAANTMVVTAKKDRAALIQKYKK